MPVLNRRYSLGCDPEVFVMGKDGEFVSAHDLIPGSKQNPFRCHLGAIQPDGTAAEFNIDPAYTAEEFSTNIKEVLSYLNTFIKDRDENFKLTVVPSVFFKKDYFRKLPAIARAFGCEPDFDAWLGKVNTFNPTDKPMRTGAGHIHIGWSDKEDINDPAHLYDCREAVKQLDSVLFPLSLLWDADETRRSLYGNLGSFRPKPFGVEYRPLSNVWVSDPDLHVWIFNASMRSMLLLDEGNTRIYETSAGDAMLEEYKAGREMGMPLTRAEIIEYHDYLVSEYSFDPLPERYLAA